MSMPVGRFNGLFVGEIPTTGDMAGLRAFGFKLDIFVDEVGQVFNFSDVPKANYTQYLSNDSPELQFLSTLEAGKSYVFTAGVAFKNGYGGKSGKLRIFFLSAVPLISSIPPAAPPSPGLVKDKVPANV